MNWSMKITAVWPKELAVIEFKEGQKIVWNKPDGSGGHDSLLAEFIGYTGELSARIRIPNIHLSLQKTVKVKNISIDKVRP